VNKVKIMNKELNRYGKGLKYTIGVDVSLLASASTTFQINVPSWAKYLTVIRYETQKNRLSVVDRNRNMDIFRNVSLNRDLRNLLEYNAPIFPSGLIDVTVSNSDSGNANSNNISFEFTNYLTLKELDDMNKQG
jgi:hypothetical protein